MSEIPAKYAKRNNIGNTFVPFKKSKYGSIKTVIDNITFDSKREANYYNTLKLLKRAGEVLKIDLQPEFPYHICLLYTSPIPRDRTRTRMPSSA